MTEKAIAYLRVSSDQQDEHSFDSQFRNLNQYLEAKKWNSRNDRLKGVELELDTRVTCKLEKEGGGVFTAEGCFGEKGSAFNLTYERTEFNEMVKYVKKHKIKHILFYRADRFSRNDEDWGVTKRQFKEAGLTDIFIHFIIEELAFNLFDTEDFEQRDRLLQLLRKAERESHDKRIYATEGAKTKFEKGELFYYPGYGYDTETIKKNKIKYHYVYFLEEQLDDVKQIFREFSKGDYSLIKFVERAEGLGLKDRKTGKPFTKDKLHSILDNSLHMGYVRKEGKLSKWTQIEKPVVSESEWKKVHEILSRRDVKKETRGDGKSYRSPLARIMRCQFCGCKIVTDPKPAKNVNYIRCSSGKNQKDPDFYIREQKKGSKYCMTGYHREELVMDAIDNEVSKLWLNEEILIWLEQELKELKSVDENRRLNRQTELEKEKEAVDARIERVEDAYEDGKYTLEKLESKMKKHKSRLNEIEAELARMNLASEDLQDQVELILELVETMQNQWVTLDYAKKASILDVLAEKVTLEEGGTGKPFIEWELPWKAILQISSSSNMSMWYARTDSNCRPSDS